MYTYESILPSRIRCGYGQAGAPGRQSPGDRRLRPFDEGRVAGPGSPRMINARYRATNMLQSMGMPGAPRGAEPAVSNSQAKSRCGSSIFGAIAIGLLVFSHSPTRAADNVRIGVGIDPSFTTWWIAKDRGFFDKHNIHADITQFSGTPDMADA